MEHPETQIVTAGEWANFTCSINCSEKVSLCWRLVAPAVRVVNDIFSLTKRLMRMWGKKGVVIQSKKSESDDFKSVTLHIQAPSTEMNGSVLQCGAINSRENFSSYYSKFAILLVEEESPELESNDNIVREEDSTNATTTPPSQCIKITEALTGLRIIGYNRSRVNLVWQHPDYPTSSFTYLITSKPLQSGAITKYPLKTFLKEDDPFISIDLEGTECELVEIRVAMFGEEEEAQSVNVTLPSCELVWVFIYTCVSMCLFVKCIVCGANISKVLQCCCSSQPANFLFSNSCTHTHNTL